MTILKRTNLNIAIIGTSGGGKSVTSKMILNRIYQKFPDSHMYVIDPMNEYGKIADYFGMENLDITNSDEKLGLDPFQILSPEDAADSLADVTNAPDLTRFQFQKYAGKARNIKEFYKLLPKDDAKYIDHLVEGPQSRIMTGEPKIATQDKLVVSMSGGSTASQTDAMILVLLLNKIYKLCEELPAEKRKILVIDEAWRMFKMPKTTKYIDLIVRGGRKLNLTFVFISQRVEDISVDSAGIGKIIDNIATLILLRLQDQPAEYAKEILNLSEIEIGNIKRAAKGQALFITERHKANTQFVPTESEMKVFDTTPLK